MTCQWWSVLIGGSICHWRLYSRWRWCCSHYSMPNTPDRLVPHVSLLTRPFEGCNRALFFAVLYCQAPFFFFFMVVTVGLLKLFNAFYCEMCSFSWLVLLLVNKGSKLSSWNSISFLYKCSFQICKNADVCLGTDIHVNVWLWHGKCHIIR